MTKIKIYEDSVNYTASVIKLPIKQKLEGLDNLVGVEIFGNMCLIGKDSDPTWLYLYFPAGCQLSQKYLSMNNLYRDPVLNNNQNEKSFFEPNGRVRGLKLKGVVSTGFIIPLISLEYMYPYSEGGDASELKTGDEFNEWCGVEICRKYIPKGTTTPGAPGSKDKQGRINTKMADILLPNQLRFHTETTHLAKNLHKLNPDDILVITDKWHGSSCLLSKVYVNTTSGLNWWQKLWNKLLTLPKFDTRKMALIASSGKPKSNLPKYIENTWQNTGVDYYGTNIWREALDKYKDAIQDGITLYGELVGFQTNGNYIQKGYDYKAEPATVRFMVYRITYTKPNGEFIEFSWQQIKDYCSKWSLEHVKELYFGRAGFINPANTLTGTNVYDEITLEEWRNALFAKLQTSYNLEKNCTECNNKVPAEGIVVRIDGHLNTYDAFKVKSKLFVLGETNAEETNIEEQQ